MHRPPPLPTRRELQDCDLSRFVRTEDEMDALLDFVQRSSFAPEPPVGPGAFGPMAPPPVPSERVNLEAIVDRLSSMPAPTADLRRPTDPTREWSPIDLDEVLRYVSLAPSRPAGSLHPPTIPPRTASPLETAAIATLAFALGSAMTLTLVGTIVAG